MGRRTRERPLLKRVVTIEHDGRTIGGTYWTQSGMITVSSGDLGSKSTKIGGRANDANLKALARIMLREMVDDPPATS
jgi:hypothetical protein